MIRSYLLAAGEEDRERLTILNELYNPVSLNFLQLEPGMNVLTVGCGIGLLEKEIAEKIGKEGKEIALDVNPLQLSIAEENRENLTNLSFHELDIAQLDALPGRFDRVHCRFVLSHFPWDSIEKLLPLLLSKRSPLGVLVLEEVWTCDSLSCQPFSEEYELWKKYVRKQFEGQGSDFSPGKRIYEHLKKQNYSIACQIYQPILKTKREKKILSLGLLSLIPGLIAKGLASRKELKDAIQRLKKLEEDESVFPRYCEMSQLFIR